LGLPTIPLAHTGENVSAVAMEALQKYDLISHNKIESFVLDNTSNYDRSIEELGQKLQWWDPASRRICCFGHILHLIAIAVLFVNYGNRLEDLHSDDFDSGRKQIPLANSIILSSRTVDQILENPGIPLLFRIQTFSLKVLDTII